MRAQKSEREAKRTAAARAAAALTVNDDANADADDEGARHDDAPTTSDVLAPSDGYAVDAYCDDDHDDDDDPDREPSACEVQLSIIHVSANGRAATL